MRSYLIRSSFIFGPLVVYARDRLLARQACEIVLRDGLPEDRCGSVMLWDGQQVRWVSLKYD